MAGTHLATWSPPVGLVKDATGGAVGNSKVKLQSRATAAVREQTTDGKGLYQFEVLPPGEYETTVEARGFKQFQDSRVRLQVAQISRLNVQLEIGSASEFVEVQGTGESGVFTRGQLDRLVDLADLGITRLRQLQREAMGDAWPFHD